MVEPEVGAQVFDHLGESGVSHAVTAVLLNFRAYDTLFEVGVLFAAGIALLALRGSAPLAPPPEGITRTGVAVRTSGLLVPFFVLSGGYLLWLGSHGPGGAFQGAAVGGAAGIYLYLVRAPKGHSLRDATWRLLLCAGFGVFLLAGAAGLGAGAAFLEYPPRWAGLLILLIESAVAASIAATLVILFLASPEQPREQPGVAD